MSTRLVLAAIGLTTLLLVRPAAAQTPGTGEVAAVPQSRYGLALGFQDQQIADIELARLVELVARLVPSDKWGRFTVPATAQPWSVVTLVDRVYDYFPKGRHARKETAEALAGLIRRHNPQLLRFDTGFKAGTRIKVPPFPVRATTSKVPRYRVFSASDHASIIYDNPSKLVLGRDGLAVGNQLKSELRLGANVRRQATFTIMVFPTTGDDPGARLKSEDIPDGVMTMTVLPPSLGTPRTARTLGSTAIELLDVAAADCVTLAEAYFKGSPYWLRLERMLASLSSSERAEMARLALQSPLTLIDIDFAGAGIKHGKKVRSVVSATLEALGLSDLDPAVRTEDLCPSTPVEKGALSDLVKRFVSVVQPEASGLLQTRALNWIQTSPAGCQDRHFTVPDQVVAAILWDRLRDNTLLSLSFRADGAIRASLDMALTNSTSLALVAAGNERKGLEPGWTLQESVAMTEKVITVTHGAANRVDGTFTHPRFGMKVWLAAPGCGIGVLDESGSSLATPMVATVTWVGRLLRAVKREQAFDDEVTVRAALTAASLVTPPDRVPVESSGLFDAVQFIGAPVRHIRFDGRIEPVTAFKLVYGCAGESESRLIASEHGSDALMTVMPYRRGDQTFLWRREIQRQAATSGVRFVHERVECQLTSLSLSVTTANGVVEQFDLTRFAKTVAVFTF